MINIRKGLEMEFFVVDENLNPYNEAYQILNEISNPFIHKEFGPYQLEVTTRASTSSRFLEKEIKENINLLKSKLPEEKNLLSIGAYPLDFEPRVVPDRRLQRITKETNKTFNFKEGLGVELETGLQSFQINFSLENFPGEIGEQTIKLHNILRPTIPLMVALTANSPYFKNSRVTNPLIFDENYDCESVALLNGRRHIWERCEGKSPNNECLPGFGVPEEYSSFKDYINFLSNFSGMGNPVGMESQLYVDIRPRTEDKAGKKYSNEEIRVEYRPADMLPLIGENMGVVSFLEGYIRASLEGKINSNQILPTSKLDLERLSTNASIYGFDTKIGNETLRDKMLSLMPIVEKSIPEEDHKYLSQIKPLIFESYAERQIKIGSERFLEEIIKNFNNEVYKK